MQRWRGSSQRRRRLARRPRSGVAGDARQGVTVTVVELDAPPYCAFTLVMPRLTPTTTPLSSTVAVLGLSVDQCVLESAPPSFFFPSASVATAVSWFDLPVPSVTGSGPTLSTDTEPLLDVGPA